MDAEEYRNLIARLEEGAARHPRLYRMRTLLLALVGYGYLLLVLAVLVGSLVGLGAAVVAGALPLITVKLVVVIVPVVFVIARSLFVTIPSPPGVPIDAASFPGLFALIDELVEKTGAPSLHAVLVDGEFNAAVVQRPRLAGIWFPENILVIGLPLLQALSPRELEAVLTHEMGHLSGAHGKFGAWVYRVRASWSTLLAALAEKRSRSLVLFTAFVRWYTPLFSATSLVLAREHELEADRMSVRQVGARGAADALVRVVIEGMRFHHEFGTGLSRRAREAETPPSSVFADTAAFFSTPVTDDAAGRWLESALRAETGATDTHPSLRDRLAAMGETPRVPPPSEASAFAGLPAAGRERLERELGGRWAERNRLVWGRAHREWREKGAILRDLEVKRAAGGLSPQEGYDRAHLLLEFDRTEEGVSALEALAAEAPDFYPARFSLGLTLLTRGDERGLSHLEAAMAGIPQCAGEACAAAEAFLTARGRVDDARRYRERGEAFAVIHDAAVRERNEPIAYDQPEGLREHGLSADDLAPLVAALAATPEVRAAYLVRRDLKYMPEVPVLVLAVRLTPGRLERLSLEDLEGMHTAWGRALAGRREVTLLMLDGMEQRIARRFEEFLGDPVYRAD